MADRPFAYVCSPYKGDTEANTARAREYSRKIFDVGYTPLAPHLLFPQFLNDSIPKEREAGMEMGLQLLANCRALVVCGNEITEGMAREIRLAEELSVPIHTLDALLTEPARDRSPVVTSMNDTKRFVDGYEITQAVKIDGMEIVVGENPDADKPYMTWRRSLGKPFGAESHLFPVFDGDYLKILREFIHSQSVCADNLGLERVYRGSFLADAPLTADDCVKGGMREDSRGKVVAIKAEALSPEYRACSHQLILAECGFGCAPDARGRTVFGVNVYSGAQERWMRSDILGVVAESSLPEWVSGKLTALRKRPEKESVIGRIREDRQAAKPDKPTIRKHGKDGLEL